MLSGAFKHLDEGDASHIRVEIISNEAIKTSEIEGEYLDRESAHQPAVMHRRPLPQSCIDRIRVPDHLTGQRVIGNTGAPALGNQQGIDCEGF